MTQLTEKERTAQMNDIRSFDEQMPCVGIFWYDPADHSFFGVRKKEITPQMVEDAAEKGSPVISYPDVRGELSADDSRLAGRVVWSIDKFIVLVGKWAEPMQEALTELLEKEFSLPYFEFVYDEHWDLSTGGRGICRDKGVDLWFDARSDSKVILDDAKLPEGYPGRRHQYADGSRRLQNEALDEQKCLVFFCLLAEDGDQRPRECDIWKRKPICLSILDSRDGREK